VTMVTAVTIIPVLKLRIGGCGSSHDMMCMND
jgi:hypothetical protein